MKIFQIVLFIIILGSESLIFVWSTRLSHKVFLGQITSFKKQLGVSTLSGLSVGLLFVLIALFVGLLNSGFHWSLQGLIGVSTITIALFILGTIGSIWRFNVIGKFRSRLIDKIMNKNDEKRT